MKITRTPIANKPVAASRPEPKSEPKAADNSVIKDTIAGAVFMGAGAVPVLGAGLNFMGAVEGQFNEQSLKSKICLAGAFSNLAGSATLATGLAMGSQTAAYVGLGMLGVSSLAITAMF